MNTTKNGSLLSWDVARSFMHFGRGDRGLKCLVIDGSFVLGTFNFLQQLGMEKAYCCTHICHKVLDARLIDTRRACLLSSHIKWSPLGSLSGYIALARSRLRGPVTSGWLQTDSHIACCDTILALLPWPFHKRLGI